MKEPQVLPQAAEQAYDIDTLFCLVRHMLDGRGEPEGSQGIADAVDDLKVGVGNAQDAAAVASFCIEDSGQKTRLPLTTGPIRPGDQLADAIDLSPRVRADREHRVRRLRAKAKLLCLDVLVRKPLSGTLESLGVAQGQSEGINYGVITVVLEVPVAAHRAIAANETAEIAGAIVHVLLNRVAECAGAQELVVAGEMRSLAFSAARAGDELPAALGEKPVIVTHRQLCSILQSDPIRRLDDAPARQNHRRHVTPIPAFQHRAVDQIALLEFRQLFRASVHHQYACVTRGAVNTG